MEKLIINVPKGKSALIKELLKELGVTIEQEKMDMEAYREKILKVGVWTDEDLKPIEEARSHFNSLKPAQW
jgi:hypothetical protein